MLTSMPHRILPGWRFIPEKAKIRLARRRRTFWHVSALALSLICADCPATTNEAEKPYPPWDRAALSLGGNVATLNSSVSFGINGAAGLSVTPEELLGLDSSLFVFGAGAFYRLGEAKRHQISLSYVGYHRSGSTTLTDQIQIGDNILLPGTQLSTVFNFDIIRATYTYAVFQDDRVRIGLGLGFYIAPININVKVTSSDQTLEGGSMQTTLPLPVLALGGELRLTPKFSLLADVNAMYLSIDNFQGGILDTTLAMEYRLWKHFGLGLAVNAMAINVEAQGSDTSYPGADFFGKVNVQYGSLFLYGKLAF
jgi:hypothetical protein